MEGKTKELLWVEYLCRPPRFASTRDYLPAPTLPFWDGKSSNSKARAMGLAVSRCGSKLERFEHAASRSRGVVIYDRTRAVCFFGGGEGRDLRVMFNIMNRRNDIDAGWECSI